MTAGRAPVASVYMVPRCLSASAAKQKTLQVVSVMSGGIQCGVISSSGGASFRTLEGGATGAVGGPVIVGLVLRMPVRGRFIWPFEVAGLGARYFRTRSAFIIGNPCSWLLLMALMSVDIGGLKKAWCMYLSCCCLNGSVYMFIAV